MAEAALEMIPARLRRHVAGIAITVEELAEDALLADLGIDSAWDLTGVYLGTPLNQRSIDDIARTPDAILLFRQAILLEWIELGEDLSRLVRSVLIHEIAHHFGFSDAEIEALERE